MSTLLALTAFAGLIAVLWAVDTVMGRGTNAAARQVFRKSHVAGRAQMSRTLTFTAPVGPDAVAQKILDRVNAHPSAPAIAGGLFVFQRTPTLIVFAVGSKLDCSMRARVDLRASASGSAGTFSVIDWKESGAHVIAHQYVDKLIERIGLAVRDVSGTLTESSTSP